MGPDHTRKTRSVQLMSNILVVVVVVVVVHFPCISDNFLLKCGYFCCGLCYEGHYGLVIGLKNEDFWIVVKEPPHLCFWVVLYLTVLETL